MLNDHENILSAIDEIETNAIILIDNEGYIQKINKGLTILLGFCENDVIGKRVEVLLPVNVQEMHRSLFDKYVASRHKEERGKSKLIGVQRIFPDMVKINNYKSMRFSAIHKNLMEVPIHLTINEIWSQSNSLIGFIGIISDNTEQYNSQQQLEYQATHDQLTGLINWQEFIREVQITKNDILEKTGDYYASLLFFNVDYFKTITYSSQKAGDSALKKIATWLLNQVRQKESRYKDTIGIRFFSDEFVVYLPSTSTDGAMKLAYRLKSEFKKINFRTIDNPFHTTISIGISKILQTTKLQDALSQVTNACNNAKKKGKDKAVIAQPEATNYMELESVIREALNNQRFILYAQRILAISPSAKSIDNNLAHYEVLLRLEDKQGNIISPAEFIPAAESIGLAIEIDKYVIKKTFATLQKNPEHVKVLSLCSINLSGITASNEGMFSFIEQKLQHHDLDPCKFCFELTETHQVSDNEISLDLVSKLRILGCKFSFDDFGIGYSNYQSFSRLPVDIIKIDGYYVRNALKNEQLRTDMQGIINSAKIRGLRIVGEFTENKEIVKELESLGVDFAQGYYIGKPMPLETLIKESLLNN